MKLTPAQIEIIREQTGFSPLPEEVALSSGLSGFFGDNTFYTDSSGVYIFEEIEEEGQPEPEGQPVTAIMIAALEPTGNGDEMQVRAVQARLTTTTVDIA